MKRLANRNPQATGPSRSSLLFAVAVTCLLFGCDDSAPNKQPIKPASPTSAPATKPDTAITVPASRPATTSPIISMPNMDREGPQLPTD